MFKDVITKQPRLTEKVLRSLIDGPLSVTEIAHRLGVEKGGDISKALDQLCESGIVSGDHGRNPETGAEVRSVRYRLSDNYVRFYLKYIEPNKRIIDQNAYSFVGLEQFKNRDTVLGLAFENLVISNYRDILPLLRLERTIIKSAAPYRKSGSKKTGAEGFQIDLLLQSELSYVIVEIKRKERIDYSIIDEVTRKVKLLKKPSEISVRTVLIYEGELDQTVDADGYFDATINIRDLLKIAN